jgi:hypothetical protein
MDHDHYTQPSTGGSRGKIALAIFLAIGAFFLLSEHRAHLFGYLPYLLLLACPLLHMFHHGGHGGHGGHGTHASKNAPGTPNAGSTKEG